MLMKINAQKYSFVKKHKSVLLEKKSDFMKPNTGLCIPCRLNCNVYFIT